MSGRPNMGRAPQSATLAAWIAETDAVRKEYRRREREAAGSGDSWLTHRLDLLRQVSAEESQARIAHSLTQSPTGMFDTKARGGSRVGARTRGARFLSMGRTGGGAA